MKKNILFCSMFDLTIIYREVAKALEEAGHSIFWTVTDRHWHDWLLKNGISSDAILSLIHTPKDFVSNVERKQLLIEIKETEHNCDLSVNQCLQMDRFILYQNRPNINEYMYLYYRDIKRYMADNRINLVLGEPTHSNDLLTYMISRSSGAQYLAPCDLRYPRGRMFFAEGYLQARQIAARDGEGDCDGAELLRTFQETKSRPFYFDLHNREPVITPGMLLQKARNRLRRRQVFNQPNLTHPSVLERAKYMLGRLINGFDLRHCYRYDKFDEIEGRIAFYGLHIQPESSIDVKGSYFSDQIKLIKDIRRALPIDITLVVKEHPNFLGIRGRSYFRQIRKTPNVKFVSYDLSTFEIYQRAAMVFTVSGTIAYEAGMLGIPSITFSPMYFGDLSSVYHCGEISQLKGLLETIEAEHRIDPDHDGQVLEKIVKRSYPGWWSDPVNLPQVMEPQNLSLVKAAFLEIADAAST